MEEDPWPEETLAYLKLQSPPISYQEVVVATKKDDTMNDLAKTIQEQNFPSIFSHTGESKIC